jgi:hypothetical protein
MLLIALSTVVDGVDQAHVPVDIEIPRVAQGHSEEIIVHVYDVGVLHDVVASVRSKHDLTPLDE